MATACVHCPSNTHKKHSAAKQDPYIETIALIDYMNTRIEGLRNTPHVDAIKLYGDLLCCFHGTAPSMDVVMADLKIYYGMMELKSNIRSGSTQWVSFPP